MKMYTDNKEIAYVWDKLQQDVKYFSLSFIFDKIFIHSFIIIYIIFIIIIINYFWIQIIINKFDKFNILNM